MKIITLLLPLALQPFVGFGLSNNVPPFCPTCHQPSPSKIIRHFRFKSQKFPATSPSASHLFGSQTCASQIQRALTRYGPTTLQCPRGGNRKKICGMGPLWRHKTQKVIDFSLMVCNIWPKHVGIVHNK